MLDKNTSSAKIIDGTLIISLPDAINPVVWQMELGQSKASALEIRSNDNGTASLVLKTPRQDIEEIANFTDRAAGLKALMTISHAMEKSSGQLKGTGNIQASHSSAPKSVLRSILKISAITAGVLLTLFVIINIAAFMLGKGKHTTTSVSAENNAPMSAEEFLEGR